MIAKCALALLVIAPATGSAKAQTAAGSSAPNFSRVESLGLPASTASKLKQDLTAGDYVSTERLLLAAINRDPHSQEAGRLLAFAGGVYFLDHDFLNAAIAWNKSNAITPLAPMLRFSLAMDYIQMGHADWAHKVLEGLASQDSKNALYPYWLGRLDYDAHSYSDAIHHFKNAIRIAPDMSLAYNNLGLCYYSQNQNALAIANYQKAIDLERNSTHPSAWPYLNLAVTLQFINQPHKAVMNLRRAIQLDPKNAEAHFHLGNVLESLGQTEAAISEFQSAAHLDADYAEPHYALARIYRKLGRQSAARDEVRIYLRIHSHTNGSPSPPANSPH